MFFYLGHVLGNHRYALAWLVAISLFFYAWWNPAYLGLLLLSIIFNYSCGILLSKDGDDARVKKKLILYGSITINMVLLGYFKYANFFVSSLNTMADANWQINTIILPLGISFFTFTQIAFLVDTYRGTAKEFNFLHYVLFVTYFPHLIAGPVLHHKEMMPQFAKPEIYKPQLDNLSIGMTIFVIGLFKKLVLADMFATYATPVFALADHGGSINFFQAWEGSIAYTLQLYFDFSGYSDMAIGLSRLFGIKLPLNFNAPYQACNIIDFWRRWHMTLSRFLRDYLYFGLGGNRKGEFRRYINLFLTMLLGGLWHGAGWTFVAWGALHGFYLIINHLWQKLWGKPIDRWWSRGIARTITLLAVVIGWVFFKASTFDGALSILHGMINLPTTFHGRIGPLEGILVSLGFGFDSGYLAMEHYTKLAQLMFWLAVLLFWPTTQQLMRNFDPAIDYKPESTHPLCQKFVWRPSTGWSVLIGVIAFVSILHLGKISEFLYFQF